MDAPPIRYATTKDGRAHAYVGVGPADTVPIVRIVSYFPAAIPACFGEESWCGPTDETSSPRALPLTTVEAHALARLP